MKMLITVLVFLVIGLFNPCIAGSTSDAVKQLQWLDNADPVKDAHAAIAKGDYRLKAVAGITILIPGVPSQRVDVYRQWYGITVISSTSDAPKSNEHARLNGLATKYAEQYNGAVLKSVRK